jgi:acetoin utilization deacetylase AcuC-like enzyme
MPPRLRCFYHPDYFLALPAGHPFPMEKFPQAHDLLAVAQAPVEIALVGAATPRQLRRVHQSTYLEKLRGGTLDDTEIHKLGLPWQPKLLHRSALETSGTIAACRHALTHGMAANLAGGTHHAFSDRGLGYCVLNDVAVAIRELHESIPALRVFVADTDAHQGNGTHAIFRADERVFTYSIHGERNYPSAKEPGSLDVGLPREVSGEAYLAALTDTLPSALDEFTADLVVWISGADVHEQDRFGQMRLTTAQMAERDRLVTSWCLHRRLPVAVLYGGGYHREPGMTARLHANTIQLVAEHYMSTRGRDERPARPHDSPRTREPHFPASEQEA